MNRRDCFCASIACLIIVFAVYAVVTRSPGDHATSASNTTTTDLKQRAVVEIGFVFDPSVAEAGADPATLAASLATEIQSHVDRLHINTHIQIIARSATIERPALLDPPPFTSKAAVDVAAMLEPFSKHVSCTPEQYNTSDIVFYITSTRQPGRMFPATPSVVGVSYVCSMCRAGPGHPTTSVVYHMPGLYWFTAKVMVHELLHTMCVAHDSVCISSSSEQQPRPITTAVSSSSSTLNVSRFGDQWHGDYWRNTLTACPNGTRRCIDREYLMSDVTTIPGSDRVSECTISQLEKFFIHTPAVLLDCIARNSHPNTTRIPFANSSGHRWSSGSQPGMNSTIYSVIITGLLWSVYAFIRDLLSQLQQEQDPHPIWQQQ